MCEYCGCQAVNTIAELTAEHDDVVTLVGEVRKALDAGRIDDAAKLSRSISSILEPHTAVEEHGLFPALKGAFPEHVAALEAEHRTVEAVLAEAVGGTPSDPTWPTRLLRTLEVLRDHILEEQDGVFPAALAELDSEDWERIEDVRSSLLFAEDARLAGAR